jgi:hypothetical protein
MPVRDKNSHFFAGYGLTAFARLLRICEDIGCGEVGPDHSAARFSSGRLGAGDS